MAIAMLVKPVFDFPITWFLANLSKVGPGQAQFSSLQIAKLLCRVKMEEYAREPCPWRIIDDCGGAFSMGLIGGRPFEKLRLVG